RHVDHDVRQQRRHGHASRRALGSASAPPHGGADAAEATRALPTTVTARDWRHGRAASAGRAGYLSAHADHESPQSLASGALAAIVAAVGDTSRHPDAVMPFIVSGELRVPGDKSISHRALLLSALARGESV